MKTKMIPLTVLLVCTFALIGTGFALQSSVTSSNNTLQTDCLTLDMGSVEYLTPLSDVGTGDVDNLLGGRIGTQTNQKTGTDPGIQNTSNYQASTNFKVFGSTNAEYQTIDLTGSTATGNFTVIVAGNGVSESITIDTSVSCQGSVTATFATGNIYSLTLKSNNVTAGDLTVKLTVSDEVPAP